MVRLATAVAPPALMVAPPAMAAPGDLVSSGRLKIRITARVVDPQGTVHKVSLAFRVKKKP
jgi:hypothetical protein